MKLTLRDLLMAAIFSVFSCGPSNPSTKDAPTTQPPQETTAPSTKTYPIRVIPEIPPDLTAKKYKNTTGDEVIYDHAAQLSQLFNLEKQDKKLWLVIGRGNAEKHAPLDVDLPKRTWVYGNIQPSTLVKNETPHLLMNFDETTHLKTIPDQLFNGLVFDLGVVVLFRKMAEDIVEFHRILKPDGKLFIDSSVYHFPDLSECRDGKNFTTSKGRAYCIPRWGASVYVSRPHGERLDDDEVKEMVTTHRANILSHAGKIFGSPEKCKFQTNPKEYPIQHPDFRYQSVQFGFIECIK